MINALHVIILIALLSLPHGTDCAIQNCWTRTAGIGRDSLYRDHLLAVLPESAPCYLLKTFFFTMKIAPRTGVFSCQ